MNLYLYVLFHFFSHESSHSQTNKDYHRRWNCLVGYIVNITVLLLNVKFKITLFTWKAALFTIFCASLSFVCVLFFFWGGGTFFPSLWLPSTSQTPVTFSVLYYGVTTVLAWVSDNGTYVQYVNLDLRQKSSYVASYEWNSDVSRGSQV